MGIDEFIHTRQINGGLLVRLRQLSADELKSVELIIDSLTPSANFLREVINLADEICARDGISLAELLSRGPIAEAIAGEGGGSVKQRQQVVRRLLEQLRFPIREMIVDELKRCEQAVAKRTGLRVKYPRDLEGDTLSVEVATRDPEQFVALANQLRSLSDDPNVLRMFSILRGESEDI